MENEYYAIELEDYSVPPICSGCTKTYAGTKQLISEFMEVLAASARGDSFDTLIDACHAWLRGEPTGEVDHGYYCKCWNIRPLEVCHITEIDRPDFCTEHLNSWRWPYIFKADRVRARIVYARDGKYWYRFIRAAFWNLQYDALEPDFVPVGHHMWGHPAMLKEQDGVLFDRLLFREREFDSREKMLQDISAPAEVDFSGFMSDILGDG